MANSFNITLNPIDCFNHVASLLHIIIHNVQEIVKYYYEV